MYTYRFGHVKHVSHSSQPCVTISNFILKLTLQHNSSASVEELCYPIMNYYYSVYL